MLVAVGTTGLLTVLGIEPAESQAGQATAPGFYAVLFVLSTFVGVPMEELFFRGLLQRHLAESSHPAFAIAVASLLFTSLHTGVAVGSGGKIVALGMFLPLQWTSYRSGCQWNGTFASGIQLCYTEGERCDRNDRSRVVPTRKRVSG